MASVKAPKGGQVSVVNGQFYEGGEFMPDHGRFCGKGKYKVTAADFDAMAAHIMAARGWTLRYNEAKDVFQAVLATGNVMSSARSLRTLAAFCK